MRPETIAGAEAEVFRPCVLIKMSGFLDNCSYENEGNALLKNADAYQCKSDGVEHEIHCAGVAVDELFEGGFHSEGETKRDVRVARL